MRKITTPITLVLLMLCSFSFTASAQDPTFNINGKDICENQPVEIDITVANFEELLGFQFTVGWNPTIIQIDSITNINAAVSDIQFGVISQENNHVSTSWFNNALEVVSIDDDEVLFTIVFSGVGEDGTFSTLNFIDSPAMLEAIKYDENNDVITVTAEGNNSILMVTEPSLMDVEVTNDVNMSGVGSIDISITGGTAPYDFAWESGETTEDISDVTMGDYTCVITDAKGCVETVGPFTVDNVVGVNEIEGLINVQLSPNPNTGIFNLQANFEASQTVDINIYNVFGQKVYTEFIESANIASDIDVSDLANGTYIVQLSTDNGMHVERMSIQR